MDIAIVGRLSDVVEHPTDVAGRRSDVIERRAGIVGRPCDVAVRRADVVEQLWTRHLRRRPDDACWGRATTTTGDDDDDDDEMSDNDDNDRSRQRLLNDGAVTTTSHSAFTAGADYDHVYNDRMSSLACRSPDGALRLMTGSGGSRGVGTVISYVLYFVSVTLCLWVEFVCLSVCPRFKRKAS